MKHNKAVGDSLEHWIEMYNFIYGYVGEWDDYECSWKYRIQHLTMMRAIHTYPNRDYCAMCDNYSCATNKNLKPRCPLGECACSTTLWGRIVFAATKEDWLKNAKLMLKKLWDLRYYNEDAE